MLKVIGYYHANELLTELDLKPVARRIADRIQQQQGHAVTLLVRHCTKPAEQSLLLVLFTDMRAWQLSENTRALSVQVDNSKLGAFADNASHDVLQARSLHLMVSNNASVHPFLLDAAGAQHS